MAVMYSLARIMGIFVCVPFLNKNYVPGVVRIAVLLALIAVVVPHTYHGFLTYHPSLVEGTSILIKELFVGLLMGVILAVPFWAVEAMGAFVDMQRGASIAGLVNPVTGHDDTPLGFFLDDFFITIFLVSGGLLIVLSILYNSYLSWPIFEWWPRFQGRAGFYVLEQLDLLMKHAFLLFSPLLVVMFLSEFGLALVNRFAPQLQVFFLGMPLKSAAAFLVLALYADEMLAYFHREFNWVAILSRIRLMIQ